MKSKDQDAAVPPLDETLRKIIEPDPEVLSQNKSVIDEFRRSFEVKENPKVLLSKLNHFLLCFQFTDRQWFLDLTLQLKKSTRRNLRDKPSGSREEGEDIGNGSDAQPMDAIEYTSKIKVDDIGDLNPVQDFEAMMSRRDGPEWVSKGIQFMKNKVFDIVEKLGEGDTSQKALECVVALRKGCILEQVSLSLSPVSPPLLPVSMHMSK